MAYLQRLNLLVSGPYIRPWHGCSVVVVKRASRVCRRHRFDRSHHDLVLMGAGQWARGKQHGPGMCEYANGATYQGDWAEGQRCACTMLMPGATKAKVKRLDVPAAKCT